MSTASLISRTFIRRSAKTMSWILSTISDVVIVFGCDPSLVCVRPRLNSEPKDSWWKMKMMNPQEQHPISIWLPLQFFPPNGKIWWPLEFRFYLFIIENTQRCLTWIQTRLFDKSIWHLQLIHFKKLLKWHKNVWKKATAYWRFRKLFNLFSYKNYT